MRFERIDRRGRREYIAGTQWAMNREVVRRVDTAAALVGKQLAVVEARGRGHGRPLDAHGKEWMGDVSVGGVADTGREPGNPLGVDLVRDRHRRSTDE
jgi:hypothetical protein